MPLPLEKAKKIVGDYIANNYNAKETALENGYSPSYAHSNGGYPIKAAYKTIAREILNSDHPIKSAQLFSGLTDAQIRDEYLKIILQDKDFTNKLKALMPLLREKGVLFQEDTHIQRPVVQMTMVKNGEIEDDSTKVSHISVNPPQNLTSENLHDETVNGLAEPDTKISLEGKKTLSTTQNRRCNQDCNHDECGIILPDTRRNKDEIGIVETNKNDVENVKDGGRDGRGLSSVSSDEASPIHEQSDTFTNATHVGKEKSSPKGEGVLLTNVSHISEEGGSNTQDDISTSEVVDNTGEENDSFTVKPGLNSTEKTLINILDE